MHLKNIWLGGRMIDRFHIRNHGPRCGCAFNPDTPANQAVRTKLKVRNTQICEQMWRQLNQLSGARHLDRLNYRAYLRHYCMHCNTCRSQWMKRMQKNIRGTSVLKKVLKKPGCLARNKVSKKPAISVQRKLLKKKGCR